jgi:hypothetical protein
VCTVPTLRRLASVRSAVYRLLLCLLTLRTEMCILFTVHSWLCIGSGRPGLPSRPQASAWIALHSCCNPCGVSRFGTGPLTATWSAQQYCHICKLQQLQWSTVLSAPTDCGHHRVGAITHCGPRGRQAMVSCSAQLCLRTAHCALCAVAQQRWFSRRSSRPQGEYSEYRPTTSAETSEPHCE